MKSSFKFRSPLQDRTNIPLNEPLFDCDEVSLSSKRSPSINTSINESEVEISNVAHEDSLESDSTLPSPFENLSPSSNTTRSTHSSRSHYTSTPIDHTFLQSPNQPKENEPNSNRQKTTTFSRPNEQPQQHQHTWTHTKHAR
jgi:hypothetical protein